MPLERRAERLLAMLAASGDHAGAEAPARRAALRSLAETADDASAPARTDAQVIPGPGGPIPLRLYAPEGMTDQRAPGLVFLHGGGWVAGDLDTHDGFCRRLAVAARCRIIAVDYRLAPEHPFPAALDDALAATRWAADNAPRIGVDPARLAVGGDSVGGGLAAAVARCSRDGGAPPLALQLLVCPILETEPVTASRAAFGDGYFISEAAFARDLADCVGAGGAAAIERLSPLRDADLAGLPPAIIHTAECDPFRDEGELYAVRLQDAGVAARRTRHAGMIHYFYALARAIPYAHSAAEMIGAELREAFEPEVAELLEAD